MFAGSGLPACRLLSGQVEGCWGVERNEMEQIELKSAGDGIVSYADGLKDED